MKHIVINRTDGTVAIIRSKLESGTDDPLTESEQLINELYDKNKKMLEALKGMESLIATGISISLTPDNLMEFLAARDELESLLKSLE